MNRFYELAIAQRFLQDTVFSPITESQYVGYTVLALWNRRHKAFSNGSLIIELRRVQLAGQDVQFGRQEVEFPINKCYELALFPVSKFWRCP
jgi:hypothetical protein